MNNKILNLILYIIIAYTTVTVAALPDGHADGAVAGSHNWSRIHSPIYRGEHSNGGTSILSITLEGGGGAGGGGGGTISEQWNKTFGGGSYDYAYSVQQTSDGGYILAGGTESKGAGSGDAWLIKTDANGTEQWSRTFGGINYDSAESVQQTSDNGYILAGWTYSYGAGYDDAWLIKTDANGTEQWSRTFGGLSYDWAASVHQTPDNGYILAGGTESKGAGSGDAWLIKTDANGTEQWNKIFGGLSYDWAESVQRTSEGGYILAGGTESKGAGSDDAWLIKTDANGTEQWNKTFGGTRSDWAESVQRTSEGGYILAGVFNSTINDNDAWLIKTNANGTEQWSRTFGGIDDDRAFDVNQTSDGYVLTGGTLSYGVGAVDAWLIKINTTGNEQWNRTFGGKDSDVAVSVQQTSDNGYILAGWTYSYGAGYDDAWLIKISPPTSLSIVINNGAAYTNATSVALNISAVGADEMSFSNDNSTWSTWENHVATKSWTLTSGDGLKTVYFKARNAIGEATPVNDTIILDTTPPIVIANPPSYWRGKAANNRSVIGFNVSAIDPVINDTSAGLKNAFLNASLINNTGWIPLINQSGFWKGSVTFDKYIADGNYSLNVTFFDNAGNINNSVQINVSIDNTPPSVTEVSLTSLVEVGSFTNITARISDNFELNTSDVYLNEKYPNSSSINYLMNLSGGSLFYYNFTDTAQYGRYNVTVIANDTTGNTNNSGKTWFVTAKSYASSINVSTAVIFDNITGEIAYGPKLWDKTNFRGLVRMEILNVQNVLERTIPELSLWYNTSREILKYKVNEANSSLLVYRGLDSEGNYGCCYAKIGWQGRSYVAVKGKAKKMTRLVLEQNLSDSKTLAVKETWDIGEGWTLTARGIDANASPIQAWLVLNKSGVEKDYKFIKQGEVYTYLATQLANESEVPVFVTYADNISSNTILLKYTWLISDNVTTMTAGDVFGNLMAFTTSDLTVNLTNWDNNIPLSQNSTINLMDDLNFRITDKASLEYYPFLQRIVGTAPIPAQVNATATTDVALEILTKQDTSGTIQITEIADIPPGINRTFGLIPFGKYMIIDANQSIKDNLTWIKLMLYYTKAELDASGLDENSLRLSWYNESASPPQWEILSISSPFWVYDTGVNTIDTNGYAGYVWANISHLSTFALVGSYPTPSPPPLPSGGGPSGGGGGGGGGGISGENFTNIEVREKYDLFIFKDKITSYVFTNSSNPILFVNITGNTSAGQINTAIEVLRNTSSLVKKSAPGFVYKNINIWVGTSGFAVSRNIKEAVIRFRVENAWLDSNSLSSSDVLLFQWYENDWNRLETGVVGKDGRYTFFEAKANHFSPFAISASGGMAPLATPSLARETPAATVTATPTPPPVVPLGIPAWLYGIIIILAALGIAAYLLVLRKKLGRG